MAINFNETQGTPKSSIDYYKFETGTNTFRMFGSIIPRYVYWKKNPSTNKSMSIECLRFNRDEERFDNVKVDWMQNYFPDLKCSWSYLVQVVDKEGKVKVLGLKKKLFEQIKHMGQKYLGDPTRIEKGWDCVVDRKITGSQAFDIAYTLEQLECKTRPLTAVEIDGIKKAKDIDELFPIQSPEDQKKIIESVWFSNSKKEDVPASDAKEFDPASTDEANLASTESADDLPADTTSSMENNVNDDIPF